jgi:hypothetical protein
MRIWVSENFGGKSARSCNQGSVLMQAPLILFDLLVAGELHFCIKYDECSKDYFVEL